MTVEMNILTSELYDVVKRAADQHGHGRRIIINEKCISPNFY